MLSVSVCEYDDGLKDTAAQSRFEHQSPEHEDAEDQRGQEIGTGTEGWEATE